MKTLRKLLAGVLLAAMVLPSAVWAAPAGLDNFQPGEDYPAGKFTDVPASSWYAENVEAAYELGLVRGVTDTTFEPESTITVAETLALAARLHSIYHTGAADFTQGSPWYQVYVDYAVENGIIAANSYSSYNAAATRSQFAAILAKALPEEALEAVNTVDDGMIPDVPEGAANYDAIYQLYRAGILTGNDAAGTFTPNNTIVRSEVAALVTRMADPDLRKTITLEDESADIKVTLNRTSLTLTDNKDAYQLTATVRPSTSMAVIWSSSNPNVASVNVRGYVIAGDVGTAVITATVGDATASCTVTVTEHYRIGVSPTDLSLEVGETDTLRYSYYPDDYTPSASDKVTWSSSDPSVATVDSSGKVTAISKGKAEITVTDSNGTVSSPCSVNVYTYEPAFTTPEMNYNYGPMTLVDRSHGGGVMQVVHLDRVEFTRVQAWDFYTVQELFITIEGENFCFGRNGITMRIHFYDASGNLLDTGYLSYTGDWDSTFSEEVSIGGFSVDDLEEVARVEFTNDSSNGEVLSGIVPVDELVSEPEPEPEPEPEDSMSPEMQEAVGIHNELEPLLYEGAFEHFQPVEDAMGGTVFKADRADILPGCADALENCLTDAEDMVAACGSSTYWADFKATAEEYADTIAEAIEVFRRVGGTDVASITEADEDEVQRLREDVPTLWGELAAEFTDFANTHIDEIRAYQG